MTDGMMESPSVPVSNLTCCQVPTTEPPLADPHERWCGRTGVSHPLLPDYRFSLFRILPDDFHDFSYFFDILVHITGFQGMVGIFRFVKGNARLFAGFFIFTVGQLSDAKQTAKVAFHIIDLPPKAQKTAKHRFFLQPVECGMFLQ